MPNNIGKRVRTLRKQHGYTQVQLAEQTNISQSVISNIENTSQIPSGKDILLLAAALDTVPSDLLGEKTCPICGFEYTYKEGLNSQSHKFQHQKAQQIIQKFGFYWPYQQRSREIQRSYSIFRDDTKTMQEKHDAAIRLFKALFSRSVFSYAQHDHPPFDIYIKMMLNQGSDYFIDIPPQVFNELECEYGRMEGIETGSYYQNTTIAEGNLYSDQSPRLEKLFSCIKTLPDNYVKIIEMLCETVKK